MSSFPAPPESASTARGFPLAALFLFTAFCCVLAALVMQYVQAIGGKQQELQPSLVASALGALVGLALGSVLGLAQRGPLIGLLIGGPTGMILGAIVGPLCLIPTERLTSVMGISIGGSVLLLVGAVTIRAISTTK